MKKNLFVFAALLGVVLSLVSGCVQVQSSDPSSATISNERYSRWSGNYTADLGCSLFEADKAVRAAAGTMKLQMLSRINETSKMQYEFKDIYDVRVSVDLDMNKNGQAQITIKFSKLGDKEFSKKFIAAIDEQLYARQ